MQKHRLDRDKYGHTFCNTPIKHVEISAASLKVESAIIIPEERDTDERELSTLNKKE